MKKNIIAIMFGVVLLLMASCEDFIEVDSRGQQNLDNYFQSEEECVSFVNSIYKGFASWDDWWQQILHVSNMMSTDDAWMGNLQQDPSKHYALAHYFVDPTNIPSSLTDYYYMKYLNIGSCNTAIHRIADANIPEDIKNRLVSEAKFFRAFNYWELVQNFGDVVLVLEPQGTSDLNKQRTAKAEVYAQIVKDLQEAEAVLPGSYDSEDLGRVTKWACKALLARTYLYMKDYTNAYAYANEVIEEGPYSLEPEFVNIWSVYNHNGVESIFEIQVNQDQQYYVGNRFSVVMGARGETWPEGEEDKIMDGWGWCVPSSHLEQAYLSEGDEIRRKSTIITIGDAVYGDEEENPNYQFNPDINKSGRVWRKYYVPIAMRRELTTKDRHIPLPKILLRLGEMYLTRAEAAYFNNNEGQAKSDIAFLRARVELGDKNDLSGNDLLYAIWKERRLEMASEGLRLFDLRREIDPVSGKAMIAEAMGPNGYFVQYNLNESTDPYETIHPSESQDKGIQFVEGRHELWPFPQAEIDRSNGFLYQNPNY
ncbi:RagB/SusD family nutrient uptake outer membrane protein [Plebeiibacterium marinum]|uniref:RagB/SusD family nutrient uptake outer membrane protein n=1 Tax=Plebeiibacterium marinum TaxID=2992111 RepID=A0AAE3MCX9_9BACT|nr:RagB/SusD family nutrient uptake outer membrane protein [Plebeiobacterium marinum]MCW3805638.1 RagB/SusD family nutrient uptake outer membrane protein [Plebeiobacterium marinum]